MLPPEHPRASATGDVEGIIALKHEMLGDIFDVKQFLDAQPKILSEFKKRIDPELEFFLMNATKTLIFLHLTNHLEKESSKDLIESVCHEEENQVSLLPTELSYLRGDN